LRGRDGLGAPRVAHCYIRPQGTNRGALLPRRVSANEELRQNPQRNKTHLVSQPTNHRTTELIWQLFHCALTFFGGVGLEATAMLRPQFVVLLLDGQWKIQHEGRHYGPFTTDREAIIAAIEAAQRLGCTGHDPRVLVEAPLSKSRHTEWTYGDPNPHDWETYRASAQNARSPLQHRGTGRA
jgi:hypothetical protein